MLLTQSGPLWDQVWDQVWCWIKEGWRGVHVLVVGGQTGGLMTLLGGAWEAPGWRRPVRRVMGTEAARASGEGRGLSWLALLEAGEAEVHPGSDLLEATHPIPQLPLS